jgi:putative phosphoribosyl transferase
MADGMEWFKDRQNAGQQLLPRLRAYRDQRPVVLALPRGGVVVAAEVARALQAPLDLVMTRKVGHPKQPEYAIAAVEEGGRVLMGEGAAYRALDAGWLRQAIARAQQEAVRRRQVYGGGRPMIPIEGRTAILVDDGVATGLTLRLALQRLKVLKPKSLVIAVPVLPRSVAQWLQAEADELVALAIPEDRSYRGALGAYYEDFSEVSDSAVIGLMRGSGA